MFPQTARASVQGDTDFLVNLTNDGWFGKGAEQWQQMAAAIFRAVENGVPLVRCCNNGVTCWIDSHGALRQIFKDETGGIYGAGAMTFELPLPDEKPAPTFYNRHGDWFGWGCVGITIILFWLADFSPRVIISTTPRRVFLPHRFDRQASAPVRSRALFCRAIGFPKSSGHRGSVWSRRNAHRRARPLAADA